VGGDARDGGAGRDRGVDGVTAAPKNRRAGLGRQRVRRGHESPLRPALRPAGGDGHAGDDSGCAGDRRCDRMTLMALVTAVWRPLVTAILRERIDAGEPTWLPVRGRSMRPLLASGSRILVAPSAPRRVWGPLAC